jgi:hypothetical protein
LYESSQLLAVTDLSLALNGANAPGDLLLKLPDYTQAVLSRGLKKNKGFLAEWQG